MSDTNIKQLSDTITALPAEQMADLFDLLAAEILARANQDPQQDDKSTGQLTACSKHLEQASKEISRLTQNKQVGNERENKVNNNNTNRLKRVQIAQDTLNIVEQGSYQNEQGNTVNIKDLVDSCVKQTRLFTPEELEGLTPELPVYDTQIEVVNETSLVGAKRLHDQQTFKRIGVLNFASAKNAGGGFLGGSQAQEESLARSTALYASLQECPEYYMYHRKRNKSLLYSDHMIYSADCPVLRSDNGALLEQPFVIDFITSPAPNRGALARNQPAALEQLEGVFINRIRAMLRLAVSQGCDALVLGAWGCGVFANQPQDIAGWFAEQLTGDGEFAKSFRYISFSIPENPKVALNTSSFQEAFK